MTDTITAAIESANIIDRNACAGEVALCWCTSIEIARQARVERWTFNLLLKVLLLLSRQPSLWWAGIVWK